MAEKGSGPTQADASRARWIDGIAVDIVRTWRERVTARQISREALRIYREVEESYPELIGVPRYREIVARQTGLDDSSVSEILERAESSFASWPVERPLKFRDVVQYIVASQCLNAEVRVLGIRSRLTTIIAEEIPGDL
jgi:hypothetical protein